VHPLVCAAFKTTTRNFGRRPMAVQVLCPAGSSARGACAMLSSTRKGTNPVSRPTRSVDRSEPESCWACTTSRPRGRSRARRSRSSRCGPRFNRAFRPGMTELQTPQVLIREPTSIGSERDPQRANLRFETNGGPGAALGDLRPGWGRFPRSNKPLKKRRSGRLIHSSLPALWRRAR